MATQDPDEVIPVSFVGGQMAGSTQHIARKYALNGAESWYPEKAPDTVSERSADLKRATGFRYILRWSTDGVPEFHYQEEIKLINREDVTLGLNVMQGVYTIAIILGFRNALEAAYPAIVHPLRHGASALGHPVLLLALTTLMLLGLRFFWVTRSLYALVIDTPVENSETRIKNVVRLHFPVTLLHAIFFFVLCDIFKSLTAVAVGGDAKPLVDQFILFTVILLALNGAWLLATFLPAHLTKPMEREKTSSAVTWGVSNVVFAVGAVAWLYLSGSVTSSMTEVLIGASVIFLVNSAYDLGKTSGSYIQFPGKPLAR
jgi:hypothetical protein